MPSLVFRKEFREVIGGGALLNPDPAIRSGEHGHPGQGPLRAADRTRIQVAPLANSQIAGRVVMAKDDQVSRDRGEDLFEVGGGWIGKTDKAVLVFRAGIISQRIMEKGRRLLAEPPAQPVRPVESRSLHLVRDLGPYPELVLQFGFWSDRQEIEVLVMVAANRGHTSVEEKLECFPGLRPDPDGVAKKDDLVAVIEKAKGCPGCGQVGMNIGQDPDELGCESISCQRVRVSFSR